MKKRMIISAGAALLTLAACDSRAPKQEVADINVTAPAADTNTVNAMDHAGHGNMMMDNANGAASNTRDRTIGDRTIGDRTIGDRTIGDRTIGDRTAADK